MTRRAGAVTVPAEPTKIKIQLTTPSAKDVELDSLRQTKRRHVNHVKLESFKSWLQRLSTHASCVPRAKSLKAKTHHAHRAPVKRINLTTTFLPQNVLSVVMEQRLTHSPHHAKAA